MFIDSIFSYCPFKSHPRFCNFGLTSKQSTSLQVEIRMSGLHSEKCNNNKDKGQEAERQNVFERKWPFLAQKLSIIIQQLMENSTLAQLLRQVEEKGGFGERLAELQSKLVIGIYKISDLSSQAVLQLYENMRKKFYSSRRSGLEECWVENELRIFIWALLGYLHVHEKSLSVLQQHDWLYFSPIFNHKSPLFFEFQARCLIRPALRPSAWLPDETALFATIMQQQRPKNRWNAIARELFVRSGRLFFRSPKQCRQRWMNHLDPSKRKTEWTPTEDLILLECVRLRGKKWSLAVRELDYARTEHMVKNRYKSLINNQAKRHPQKQESELEVLLIKRLTKAQDRIKIENIAGQPVEKGEENKKQMMEMKLQMKAEKEEMKKSLQEERMEREEGVLLEMRSPFFVPWCSQEDQLQLGFQQHSFSESGSGFIPF